MRGAFLCLLLLPVFVYSWDHFQFDVTFFCNVLDRTEYLLKIEWYEKDSSFSKDDLLTDQKLYRPNVGRLSFTQPGAMDGDEMNSSGYEPVAYISHDCTNDKKRVDLVLSITTLCPIGNGCHYRIIKDITNVWGKESVEADDFKQDMGPFPGFP
ncbi:hypothetical protein CAEBREN_14458 [Caenorhabditis brenneri]|uniref:Uncharacterized protein n=1 Tax=Caenorhabditis brenneri TaxID=135651 RepID=G0PBT0_CAEBE|nr:hypothetical protein CAEBREN_14458 [Caenorhabditis brenneri]